MKLGGNWGRICRFWGRILKNWVRTLKFRADGKHLEWAQGHMWRKERREMKEKMLLVKGGKEEVWATFILKESYFHNY